MAREGKLDEFKKNYALLQKQYKLPSFSELNQVFELDRVVERETEFVLREVRHAMAEKISNYLRFAETLLNPIGVPFFVFAIVKALSAEDKELLQGIYGNLARLDLEMMALDIKCTEKEEAEFVKSIFEQWKALNEDLSIVLRRARDNWDKGTKKGTKSYFG